MKKEIKDQHFIQERPLFNENNAKIINCHFAVGESPLKECKNIELERCQFEYKYPLWYCDNISLKECQFFEMARAGIWYTNHIQICNSKIVAPKTFRRSNDIILENVTFENAKETLWNCNHVKLKNIKANHGDYFAMNCHDVNIDQITLDGNYCFDGAKDVVVNHGYFNSKDAFWNCSNVTVYNSTIIGEYIGWNSKNLKFVNCKIESIQGFCYIDHLEIIDCDLTGTTLAFEYASVNATISNIDSILNPSQGYIKADQIEELIMDQEKINPSATMIECNQIHSRKEHFTVIRR